MPLKALTQLKGVFRIKDFIKGAVVYPPAADKYLGPRASPLIGVNEEVIRTRNESSISLHDQLAGI